MVQTIPASINQKPTSTVGIVPSKPQADFSVKLEGLARIQSFAEQAYQQQEPVELLGDNKFGNASELRDYIYKKVEEIATGLAADDVKLYSIEGNRFIVGGSNFQGIVDGKILAGRALDSYLQQVGTS